MKFKCFEQPTDILYILPCKKNGTVKFSIVDTILPEDKRAIVELSADDCKSLTFGMAVDVGQVRMSTWEVMGGDMYSIQIDSDYVVMDKRTYDTKFIAELIRLTIKD